MSNTSSEFPYNVIPQYKSPAPPPNQVPCLKCPPDNSVRAIIMECSKVSVIKGLTNEADINLKEWFVPIENYLEFEYTIPANTSSVALDYGMAGISGKVKFLMIYPNYLTTSLEQSNWFIRWQFVGENSFRSLGRILILNGATNDLVAPINLSNPQTVDVPLKVLLAT